MDIGVIQNKIYEIRGVAVMLDFDLAILYEVETRRLKEQVRRNIERFPADFMFELSNEEANKLTVSLRSQIAISRRGGNRYAVMAFTEQGISMLSSVLRSEIAIKVNISIMRAFVAIRRHLMTAVFQNKELEELKRRVQLLESGSEETIGAVNDLSEEMRRELDDIYLALTALSVKKDESPEREKIGFRK